MKCSNIHCNSALPGKYQPIMLLWPKGYSEGGCQPVSVTMNLHMVCEDCKNGKALIKHLISLADFKRLFKNIVYHKARVPDPTTAKLTFFLQDSFGKDFAGEVKECQA